MTADGWGLNVSKNTIINRWQITVQNNQGKQPKVIYQIVRYNDEHLNIEQR